MPTEVFDLGRRSCTSKAMGVMRCIVDLYGLDIRDRDTLDLLSIVGSLCDVFASEDEKAILRPLWFAPLPREAAPRLVEDGER